MNLIDNFILTKSNLIKKNFNIKLYKSFKINKEIYYGSYININNNKFIFYRFDTVINKIKYEYIKKINIIDLDNIKIDDKFIKHFHNGGHNFRAIELNNNYYIFTGTGFGSLTNKEKKFIKIKINKLDNLDTRNLFIKNYEINNHNKYFCIKNNEFNNYKKIYNPEFNDPTLDNGIYLFKIKKINNKKFIYEQIYNLPIISYLHKNRNDFYSGSSGFDSQTNVLYNKKEKLYYLYQRANLARGKRYIQYVTSKNLINWSPWNLIELNNIKNIYDFNIYSGTFFVLDKMNEYFCILEEITDGYKCTKNHLYYSYDCKKWIYLDTFLTINNKFFWISGNPILNNNNYYIYASNISDKSLEIYTFEKNRLSSFITEQNNIESSIKFKLSYFSNNEIRLNFKTYENGYILAQLKDKKDNVIDIFSFENFNKIKENCNEFNYIINWSVKKKLKEQYFLELKGINFEIFSINFSN